jgi:hypothetical protein
LYPQVVAIQHPASVSGNPEPARFWAPNPIFGGLAEVAALVWQIHPNNKLPAGFHAPVQHEFGSQRANLEPPAVLLFQFEGGMAFNAARFFYSRRTGAESSVYFATCRFVIWR